MIANNSNQTRGGSVGVKQEESVLAVLIDLAPG